VSKVESEGTKLELTVPENQSRIRLDKFLSLRVEKLSRSRIQKLIETKKITINGQPTRASRLVNPRELIEIVIPKPQPTDIVPEKIPLNIIFEDEHLLVVDKPAGMVVHPAYGNMGGTLVNALLYHCYNLSGVGGVKRPGIVHRLDKDTSGLLLVAKEDFTHQHLSSQFAKRTTEREYNAIIWGHLLPIQGRIESQIARSHKDRTKMVSTSKGKTAITNYRVIKHYPVVSLISLKLETGRTHQIRVHLNSIGHSVFGDKIYGGRQKKISSLNLKDRQLVLDLLPLIQRQALHAKTLGFVHPITNEFLRFESDLPDDMQNIIKLLDAYTDFT